MQMVGDQECVSPISFTFYPKTNCHPQSKPSGPPPPEPGPPPPEDGAPPPPARPAWRVVHKRPERTGKGKRTGASPAPPPPPAIAPPPPKPELPAWAQWRRESFLSSIPRRSDWTPCFLIVPANPLLSPAPIQGTAGAPLPPPPPPVGSGLFGMFPFLCFPASD
jgi:hypothetical protein